MPRESNESKAKRLAIRERFDLVAAYLNQMEEELTVDKSARNPDLEKIAVLYGKIAVNFTVIAKETNVYEE